jgi:putative sigma-54 modulation protein
MPVRITGRHLEVTSDIRDYIEKKLPRFERYTDRIQSVEFVIDKQRYQHQTEVRLKAGPVTVTAKADDADLMTALDMLADKLERQLAKNFEKLRGNKKHQNGTPRKAWTVPVTATAGNSGGNSKKVVGSFGKDMPTSDLEDIGVKIYPSERLSMNPMSLEEAAEQLHRSDEDFFCFINDEDRQMNVIYRRKDKNFGLIKPAFE